MTEGDGKGDRGVLEQTGATQYVLEFSGEHRIPNESSGIRIRGEGITGGWEMSYVKEATRE